MNWNNEAKAALSRVPFFVRKRVRKRVEQEAVRSGAKAVTIKHVLTCQKRFLNRMEGEVRGFQLETCFAPSGCPNRAVKWDNMVADLEERLSRRDLKVFLMTRVKGPLKMHHEFRVSISDCPNACSRPQIVDIGLIGACRPAVFEGMCNACGDCVAACRENAINLQEGIPILENTKCLLCGQCLEVCQTGALQVGTRGYRILVGGKLGRHPRLATELAGIYQLADVLAVVDRCLDHYQEHCKKGERFGEILEKTGINGLGHDKKSKKNESFDLSQ